MYSVKQPANRYFSYPTKRPFDRSVGQIIVRPNTSSCFDPLLFVALKRQQKALSPKNRIAESVGIFVAVTIPT